MEAVLLIGVQGAGKSTFYLRRFFQTHLRLSLDIVRTRRRLGSLIEACLQNKQRFVLDNTNVYRAERAVHIQAARSARFQVTGYYFDVSLGDAIRRNAQRTGKQVIPVKGLAATFHRLESPERSEGFDQLFRVIVDETADYTISDMP